MKDKEERILDLSEKYIKMRDERDKLLKEMELFREEKIRISETSEKVHRMLDESRKRRDVLELNLGRLMNRLKTVLELPFMTVAENKDTAAPSVSVRKLHEVFNQLRETYNR